MQLLGPHRAARVPRHARVHRRVAPLGVELFPDRHKLFGELPVQSDDLLLDVKLDADSSRHLVESLEGLSLPLEPGRGVERGRVHLYRALVERLDSLLERVVIVVPGGRLDVHEVVVETAERFHQLDEIPLDIGHLPGDLWAFRSRKHRRSDAALARELLLRLAHLHQVFASLNEGVDLRKERSLAEIPPPGFVVPRPAVHGALRGHVARLPRLPRGDGVPQRLLAVPQVGAVQDVPHGDVPAAPVDHLGGYLSK